jgi:hypothetical protein
MTGADQGSAWHKLIAPWALFLGLAAGFLTCCLAGRVAVRQNPFEHFTRFHTYLNPETLFYPTARQVRALARARLDPDKVAVIVGGSSVLYGAGQRAAELWTGRLQEILGDRYQVLNFAFVGAKTSEFGAAAAEMLSRDYPKLILVTDLAPGLMYPSPDGFRFKYFFWDASSQGLLLPDAGRADRLRRPDFQAEVEAGGPKAPGPSKAAERLAELRAQMRLNAALYFNDLWTTLAYTTAMTLWTERTRDGFLRPRRLYGDDYAGPPPPRCRYLLNNDYMVSILRNHLAGWCATADRRVKDGRRGPWQTFDGVVADSFPGPVRRRTLLLVMWASPHYLQQLAPAERANYARLSRLTARHLERLGLAAQEAGRGYAPTDYADLCHLVASGGYKLAAEVAPRVRALARRLGYVK